MINPQKTFLDLSIDEMEEVILEKEPSLRDLVCKSMHLLRLTINALARIHIVKSAIEKSNKEFDKKMYAYLGNISFVAQNLEETVFRKNETSAGTEALSSSTNGVDNDETKTT